MESTKSENPGKSNSQDTNGLKSKTKTQTKQTPFSGRVINCVARLPYNITKVINKRGIVVNTRGDIDDINEYYADRDESGGGGNVGKNGGNNGQIPQVKDGKPHFKTNANAPTVAEEIEMIASKLDKDLKQNEYEKRERMNDVKYQKKYEGDENEENLTFEEEEEKETIQWKIDPVTGNSALYSSLKYINEVVVGDDGNEIKKEDIVNEIIVGWTGEINTQEKIHYEEPDSINKASPEEHNKNVTVVTKNGNDHSVTTTSTTSTTSTTTPNASGNATGIAPNREKHNTNALNDDDDVDGEEQELEEAFKLSTTGDINLLNNADDPLFLTQENKDYLTKELNNNPSQPNISVEPVWLLRKDQLKWRQYAENVLWPDFHYILSPIQDSCNIEKNWWFDYVKFNEAYAMKIAKIYKPGDIIIIHDYYLMLLPQLLRMRLKASNNDEEENSSNEDGLSNEEGSSKPDVEAHVSIGYFHHVTFPSFEYFRCLKYRKQLIDGVLGADVVFFQDYSFQRHFVSCCKRLLDCTAKKDLDTNNHHVSAYGADILIKTMPIGIDKEKLIAKTFNREIDLKVETLRTAYAGKKIIFGRDRLDSVRGVLQKLQSFDIFLEMFPYWRDKVVMIQVSTPTGLISSSSSNDNKLERQVMELVNSINTKYGNLDFSPVQHYHMRIPKDIYLSLLRVADLCMVTSIRDAINLTALEYITVQSHESEVNKTGKAIKPLILSEFSGTPLNKEDCYIINPWDSVAVAKTIDNALQKQYFQVSKEIEKTAAKVPNMLDWTSELVHTLEGFLTSTTSMTPALNRPCLYKIYNQAERRLFLFDYDGTLTPIVKDPAAAIPTAKLYSLLQALAKDPKNDIWIISGRDQAFLNKWFGTKVPEVGLSAEHGCFIKNSNSTEWVNLTEKYDMSWQKICGDLMEHVTSKTPGSFVERKKVALTWHYRGTVPELGEFNAKELKEELMKNFGGTDIEVMEGKMNLEVRPKFVNKGEIVKRLVLTKRGTKTDMLQSKTTLDDLTQQDLPDFVLCLGDDKTDEDMFNQLNSIESGFATANKKSPSAKKFIKNPFGNYGFFPTSVGSANKQTVAKAHLTDPQQVLETLGLLVGHVSLFESAGSVDLDDRGHVQK
ncbi:hypothetical protein ACO0RG_002440 [Hanseniaspora osmophila]|uniref:Trehalose-phosphatase n=1 Tax=Hanseniaspora osmophila TaxID=56408 RepID=A0A1E5RV71_9ASCO|nr:Trehalose-phosphatase [Hanseniaspora osmophila]